MESSDKEKVEKLKKWFSGDRYAEFSGLKIACVDCEKAVIEAEVRDVHLNANGVVQGGMLYTAADFAFAVLTNFIHPDTVSQCGHITYLRPAACSRLVAEAREIARNGRNCVGEVVVKSETGDVICVSTFNGFVKDGGKPFQKTDK